MEDCKWKTLIKSIQFNSIQFIFIFLSENTLYITSTIHERNYKYKQANKIKNAHKMVNIYQITYVTYQVKITLQSRALNVYSNSLT